MSDPTPHPLDEDAEFKFSHDAEVSRTPVGALTVILLMFNSGGAYLVTMPMARGVMQVNWPLGIAFSMAAVTGLICAGYVQFLTSYEQYARKRSDASEQEPHSTLGDDWISRR